MIWLTWRQFRAPALTGAAVLAAAAIYFLVTGLAIHHTYTADLTACTPLNSCDDVFNEFQDRYENMFHFTELLVLAVPALIGMFWGAPLIGRELETGTHQFVWNQTITRSRWLAVKLIVVGLASIATAAVFSFLITWWAGPLDHVAGNKFAATTFATRDIVPLGYAAFAFALGVTAGLLLRRGVPAMAVTLAVFIGIQILIPTLVRPNLLASTTRTFAVNQTIAQQARGFYTNNGGAEMYLDGLPVPPHAWVISAPPITGLHRPDDPGKRPPRLLPAPRPGRRRRHDQGRRRTRRRRDHQLPRPIQPPRIHHLAARQPLLAAPVVRDRNLRPARRRAVRILLLADPAPTELTLPPAGSVPAPPSGCEGEFWLHLRACFGPR